MAAVTGPGSWAVRWRKLPSPRMRLFCVPHSGAGAAVYRPWDSLLPDDVELVSVRLPGREARFREPAFSRLDDLIAELADNLTPLLDVPYGWFGHSMGALVAFETCRETRRRGLPEPARLLISGRPAPHLAARPVSVLGLPGQTPARDATNAEFAALLAALNGTPGEVQGGTAAFAPFIPTLRADLSVIETYQYRPEPPLDLPISVFGGEQDPVASLEELQAWHVHSSLSCRVATFPGGHFYLHQVRERFVAALARDLMEICPPR
jgi:medium-chain acyl-[acyl-carrier-protein] hydrolase